MNWPSRFTQCLLCQQFHVLKDLSWHLQSVHTEIRVSTDAHKDILIFSDWDNWQSSIQNECVAKQEKTSELQHSHCCYQNWETRNAAFYHLQLKWHVTAMITVTFEIKPVVFQFVGWDAKKKCWFHQMNYQLSPTITCITFTRQQTKITCKKQTKNELKRCCITEHCRTFLVWTEWVCHRCALKNDII